MSDSTAGRATVASAYPFHVYEMAAQLADRGLLDRLYTTYPRRYVRGVRPEMVSSRPWLAAMHRVVRHMPVPRLEQAAHRAVLSDFDSWVEKSSASSETVIALSAAATASLRRAHLEGRRTVCDRGSWHILEQRETLDTEADKWGLARVAFDPWIIDRELEDYENADRIFVPSKQALESFTRRGVPVGRLVKAPYGVDTARFHPMPSRRDPLRILCVAAIGLQKGHQYLVEAYKEVRRPGSALVLVGRVDRAFLRWLGTDSLPDVLVTGALPRDRVVEEMQAAGVFALASIQEGLALVVPQAMATGLPIVATRATGCEEFVRDGIEGLIAPSANSHSIARALDRMLTDHDYARDVGAAARTRVLEEEGWTGYGDRIAAALAEMQAT